MSPKATVRLAGAVYALAIGLDFYTSFLIDPDEGRAFDFADASLLGLQVVLLIALLALSSRVASAVLLGLAVAKILRALFPLLVSASHRPSPEFAYLWADFAIQSALWIAPIAAMVFAFRATWVLHRESKPDRASVFE